MRMRALVLCGAIACGSSSEPSSTPDVGPSASPHCGDGVCEASEVGGCASDCGVAAACGDGTCSAGETSMSCPNDCGAVAACGDGTCTPPETADTCPGDCGTTGGGGGSAQCGNTICEVGEDATSCPSDCGGIGGNACPGTGDVDCFFCWFDPSTCIPPQTEAICEACLGLGG